MRCGRDGGGDGRAAAAGTAGRRGGDRQPATPQSSERMTEPIAARPRDKLDMYSSIDTSSSPASAQRFGSAGQAPRCRWTVFRPSRSEDRSLRSTSSADKSSFVRLLDLKTGLPQDGCQIDRRCGRQGNGSYRLRFGDRLQFRFAFRRKWFPRGHHVLMVGDRFGNRRLGHSRRGRRQRSFRIALALPHFQLTPAATAIPQVAFRIAAAALRDARPGQSTPSEWPQVRRRAGPMPGRLRPAWIPIRPALQPASALARRERPAPRQPPRCACVSQS